MDKNMKVSNDMHVIQKGIKINDNKLFLHAAAGHTPDDVSDYCCSD